MRVPYLPAPKGKLVIVEESLRKALKAMLIAEIVGFGLACVAAVATIMFSPSPHP